MTYRDDGSGRAGESGAPAGEGLGMGSFDEDHSAPSAPPKAPSFEFRPDELEQFRRTGHELIPLHVPDALDARGRPIGKAPFHGWRTNTHLTVDEAASHLREGGNVGVRLRPCDLVVDVDPRNFAAGDDPVARLQRDLGFSLDDFPKVVTGSGGLHFYMLMPEGTLVRDTAERYEGIEFKPHGRQVVAPGSAHPNTGRAYRWDDDFLGVPLSAVKQAPAALIELIGRPERQRSGEPGEFTPEQLDGMLGGLDPCVFAEHGRWLALMMACHHATAGEGREEFLAWSAGDPAYGERSHENGRRWDSLHADSNGPRVTARTLHKELIDAGRQDLIPRESAEDDFPGDVPEPPEGALASKPERVDRGLASEWVWVAGIERFVRRTDTTKFNEKQFRSMFQDRWPDGDICSAVWRGKLPIRRVEALAYVPSQPEFVSGGECVGRYNLWRPSGVEPKPGDVSIFLEHMDYLFPDEIERRHVLDYLSLLVAEDFVKVHFALLVRGKQGTGKSFLGKLLRKMIGERNVSMPLSSEVTREYTGWQEGVQLAILEELMALGRTEVANRLKPAITDDYLRIRLMYTNPYSTPNFLNLLCFTNHEDALPIEPGDRRWLVVFSEAERRDAAYYERLFGILEGDEGCSAVKHFLQQRVISLNPKGVAPATKGKAQMRRLSLGEAEQTLRDMLDEGSAPFDFDLVRVDDLIDALPFNRSERGMRNRIARWLSEEVKAVKHSRYTKPGADRPAYWLWSLGNHDHWEQVGAAGRIDAYLERWR